LVAAARQKDPSAGAPAPASTLPHITSPQIDTHVTPRSAAIARNRGSARRRKSVQAIGMLLMLVAFVLAVLAAFQGSPGGVTDRDRSAAEWVLADRNSIVWVRTDAAASAVEVDQLDELPQGPFDLIGVIAAPDDAGVPRSLDALRGLEHLNSVELYFRLEEGSVEILAGLPQLRQLTLGGFGLTGAELRPLRSHPALIQLLVGGNPIEDQYVADLAAIENLQVLGLWDTQITDAGVKSLTAAQSLEALSLDRTSVTDKGLRHLNSLDRLAHLSLDGVRGISGEGLAALVRDSKILSLNLKSSPVTNAGLQSLAAAGRLEQLDLTGNRQFTDASMQHIAQITTLRELNISWTSISNEGVRTLRSLRYLANLQLAGAAIDDDCVPYLLELSSLTELNLEDTRITRAGYDQLKEELPSCVIYWRSQVE
jgi:hypothetical protein